MKYPNNIREEELKNKVAQDYFGDFDCTKIVGNIDFCVTLATHNKKQAEIFETQSLLWAEAKKGKSEIFESFVQLILTVGKARTFDKYLPPAFLGAFDAVQIAFIPYNAIHDIFYLNDFNWNVTASNHETKEFRLVYDKVKTILESQSLLFSFDKDDKDLKEFIKTNFIVGKTATSKIKIDKNNFTNIYLKWLTAVKPTIAVNWDIAKKNGIIDGDFYLADLLSRENETLKEKLFVLLKKDYYELDRKIDELGMFNSKKAEFTDRQKAHTQFWNKYERPPKEEYWDFIVERRDLLVPQDIRERKGSYFTPQIWVELSQKYIADALGEDWQNEYYVWDCAAGTGNLLAGLINKYNIWASTLDMQDVDVMHDRIDAMNEKSVNGDGANLLHDHVFQFDFLNDDFTKLPQPLQAIINDEEKRKRLLIYINPPYAEAGNKATISQKGENKSAVANSKIYDKYQSKIGTAARELFAQFLTRIYCEIPNNKIANFSTLKNLQSSNFSDFRQIFRAKLEKIFLVQADTFDNVKGQFPIAFYIWDTNIKKNFEGVVADVYDVQSSFIGTKTIHPTIKGRLSVDWLRNFFDKKIIPIGYLRLHRNDIQNKDAVFITSNPSQSDFDKKEVANVTKNNLIEMSIYVTIRQVIEATWLNDRDQFLYPNDGWKTDTEFQNDCLAYTLFNGQNRITNSVGINHWIPFTETEVNAREKFESRFMTDFMKGELKIENEKLQLFVEKKEHKKLVFSTETQAVFDAGKTLWRYYHAQPKCNVNASLYDIREYFQGRNDKGKMNNKSSDEKYNELIGKLRAALKILASKIEPKVYEYGFLKR